MNASYDYKGLNKTMTTKMKKISLPNLIIALAVIFCLNGIINHFIAKWDGHFHDTKGCTTIQNMEGKLYQVNSCENSIVPVITQQQEEPLKSFNNFNPDDMPPPPAAKPQTPPAKKVLPPKDNEPKPPAPLMT
jgi:hypothetical protein